MTAPHIPAPPKSKSNVLKSAWRGWLKFAEVLGTVQMVIILSIVYWTIVAVIAVPFKLLSDPLSMKGPGQSSWTKKDPRPMELTEMQRQG